MNIIMCVPTDHDLDRKVRNRACNLNIKLHDPPEKIVSEDYKKIIRTISKFYSNSNYSVIVFPIIIPSNAY